MIKLIKKILFFLKQKVFVKKKITKITQNNILFTIETRDELGESWNLLNEYELSEFNVFKKINKENIKKVYYFGAHQCVIPIKLQKIFLPNSEFYCFEARKSNYLIGKQNIKHNFCEKNIFIFNEALNTSSNIENFSLFDLNTFKVKNNLFSIKVKSLTLQDIIEKHGKGDLLYFDIEGLEATIIQKNAHFLSSWKNNLFIECHKESDMQRFGVGNQAMVSSLLKNNYKLFKLKKNSHNQQEKFEPMFSSDQIPSDRYYLLAINEY